MSEKYVYTSGMDEYQGPMPEKLAYEIANENNKGTLAINANLTDGVFAISIVVDSKDIDPPWGG